MRKNFCVVLMSAVIAAGVFAQNAVQNGVIRELSGEVELKAPGAQSFKPAKAGDEVAPAAIVSTGFKSTAVIAVGSSVITVRPLTRLSLAEIQTTADAENTNVNLQAGRVRVDVKPPAGTRANFTVQGPSATASVRGTSFECDTLNLKVLEGTVAFSGSSGVTVMVRAGEESYVQIDGRPAIPADVSASSLLPSPPVGMSESASPVNASAPGDLSITLEYE